MKQQFPIWQITLPLCGVLMFTIGAITTILMINGRYLFELEVTPQELRIRTDVDKRENQTLRQKNTSKEINEKKKNEKPK